MTPFWMQQLRYPYRVIVREQSGSSYGQFFIPNPPTRGPLISCVMPTHGGLMPARFAIRCFQEQSYLDRELVVVCKDEDSEVSRYVEELADPRIKFAVASAAETVGDMRNYALSLCRGEFVAIWDDDDLSAPHRLATQLNLLERDDVLASFLLREIVWWPREKRLAVTEERLFQENTMLVRRDILPPYPSVRRGGDTLLMEKLQALGTLVALDDPAAYVYVYHGGNIWNSDHFEEIFTRASASFTGAVYARMLDELAVTLPMIEYEGELTC